MQNKLNLLKNVFIFLLFATLSNIALAQRTIRGLVTDAENKEPLVGASVVVPHTTQGTLTDMDGKYSLNVPAKTKSLIFSSTGYQSLTLKLGASNVVNAGLKNGNAFIHVIAHRNPAGKWHTNAMDSVKEGQFNQGNIYDPIQLLQGKVAGLNVSRVGNDPNGAFDLRLRGLSTITGNTKPLIVVNGIPDVPLSTLDPNDVSSMEVLKDGSAAAIYGVRGANGVILIKTKIGNSVEPKVTYIGGLTYEKLAKKIPVLSAADYKAVGGLDLGSDTDWISKVTQSAMSQNHHLSFGGVLKKGNYRTSLNYRKVEGIISDGFNQLNGRFDITQSAFNDKLTLSASIAATQKTITYGDPNVFKYAVSFNPTAPIYESAGTPNYERYGGYFQRQAFDTYNPYAMLKQSVHDGKETKLLAVAKAEYEIVHGLKYNILYSKSLQMGNYGQSYPRGAYYRGDNGKGYASRNTKEQTNDYFNTQLSYATQFQRLNIKAVAGYDYQKYDDQSFGMGASGFITDFYGYNNIGAASSWKDGLGSAYSDRSEHKLIGMFGDVNLDYNDTYFAKVNIRREGSSRLADAHKWGLFYGVSAGINLHRFFRVSWINELKARMGLGKTGNIPFASYLSKATVQEGTSYFYNGNFITSGYIPVRQANPHLKGETSTDLNFGLDFSFFNYRLRGSLDFYKKDSRDLIYKNPSIGMNLAPTWRNTGHLTNKGVELRLDYPIFAGTGNKFQWTTSFNMATFNTTLEKVWDNGAAFRTAEPDPPCNCNVTMILVEPTARVSQISAPIFEALDRSGRPIYADLNGDGRGDAFTDLATVGNGLPTLTYGWSHIFKLGRWGLDIALRGARGHSLINMYRMSFESADPAGIYNWNRVQTAHWRSDLRQAEYSNRYVEKANYLKWDNMTFSFDVAKDASKGKVFVTANNLWVASHYSGVDPEVRYADAGSSYGGYLPARYGNPDPLAPGMDRQATYWRTRSVTLGLNLTF